MTRVSFLNCPEEAVNLAKTCLLSGGLVAYPTESFYGIAVDSTNESAIERLFLIKGRDFNQPILILIPSTDSLEKYVLDIPPIASQLIQQFWPGGLTLVFRAGSGISPLLTAGTGKIGIRFSGHPVATALAQSIDAPITGTSANHSGQPACSSADEVMASVGKKIDLIVDGGQTSGKIGSTVLDITQHPPCILREGLISESELRPFLGN